MSIKELSVQALENIKLKYLTLSYNSEEKFEIFDFIANSFSNGKYYIYSDATNALKTYFKSLAIALRKKEEKFDQENLHLNEEQKRYINHDPIVSKYFHIWSFADIAEALANVFDITITRHDLNEALILEQVISASLKLLKLLLDSNINLEYSFEELMQLIYEHNSSFARSLNTL